MRKLIFLLTLCAALTVSAQVKFGYMSYSKVCRQMPQYAQAQQNLLDLKATYDKEATRGEEEFQRKFADFLDGQKDFPTNILQKRQAELQLLMDKSISFRKECEQILAKADSDLTATLYRQLDEVVAEVGRENGYAFVLNSDGNALPYVNPAMGEDVTHKVLVKLGVEELTAEEQEAIRKAEQEKAEAAARAEAEAKAKAEAEHAPAAEDAEPQSQSAVELGD